MCYYSTFMIISSCARFLWLKNRFESSANKCKSKELVQFLKLLIYSKKRSGPRTEPWGTPHEIDNIFFRVCVSDRSKLFSVVLIRNKPFFS